MFFFGVLLFLAAEVVAFVVVAERIGFLWALVVLIAVSALGPLIVRRAGIGVLAHTQDRLARGEVPTRELLDGLVVLIGGAMICVPGFIGDAIGLLLMIRPVRRLVIGGAGHWLARRVQTARPGRWRVVTVRSGATRYDRPPPPGAPARPPALGTGPDAEEHAT